MWNLFKTSKLRVSIVDALIAQLVQVAQTCPHTTSHEFYLGWTSTRNPTQNR